MMLALAPGEVRLEAAARGDIRPLAEIMPVLRERGVRAVSPNGVLGDPAGASAAEGERLLASLTSQLNDVIDRLLGGLEADASGAATGGGAGVR
jgi:creatinine amidohydrolase